MENTRVIFYIIAAWIIVGTIVFIIYPTITTHRDYVNSSFNYKINEIEFRPGHRGTPYLKLDTGWYLLRSIEEMKMVPYIQAGDSVVKKKGSTTIKVFRKDSEGHLTMREFD